MTAVWPQCACCLIAQSPTSAATKTLCFSRPLSPLLRRWPQIPLQRHCLTAAITQSARSSSARHYSRMCPSGYGCAHEACCTARYGMRWCPVFCASRFPVCPEWHLVLCMAPRISSFRPPGCGRKSSAAAAWFFSSSACMRLAWLTCVHCAEASACVCRMPGPRARGGVCICIIRGGGEGGSSPPAAREADAGVHAQQSQGRQERCGWHFGRRCWATFWMQEGLLHQHAFRDSCSAPAGTFKGLHEKHIARMFLQEARCGPFWW
jgi:hypothetical protein